MIDATILCPDCESSCTAYIKSQSRTLRVECPNCGITDHIPNDYNQKVMLSG